MKKAAVIGVGGRTGTMFAFELKDVAEVFGIGKKNEVELIKNEELFVRRTVPTGRALPIGREGKIELFKEKVMEGFEFPKGIPFDFLFLTVKNPVGSAVRYYYQKIKERNLKIPSLFLSQNGIEASENALEVLKEIFGKKSENIQVFRISLFNPVDKKISDGKNTIIYSLPIRMVISKVSGFDNSKEIAEIFKKTGFEVTLIPSKDSKNMEYSKLLLNLIGMASATRGFSVKEGFSKKEVFEEEIKAIKEYIEVVKKNKGNFLNFPHYPVKSFSILISHFPIKLLFPFRESLAGLIEKGRGGKPKNLDEIDYYNGAVVKLGKKLAIPTPINEEIIKRVKIS